MKLKNTYILSVSLILLAVLTIGAVSANDDTIFNETLTADDMQEPLDVQLDNNLDNINRKYAEDQTNDIETAYSHEDIRAVSLAENKENYESSYKDNSLSQDDETNVHIWYRESEVFTDSVSEVITVYPDMPGMMDIIVDDDVKFHSSISPGDDNYRWDLNSLCITKAGEYNIAIKFNDEKINEFKLKATTFDNSTFRAQLKGMDPRVLYLFTPEGKSGTVKLTFKHWNDEDEQFVTDGYESFELDESYWNKWVAISSDFEEINVSIDDAEIDIENNCLYNDGNYFEVSDREIRLGDDVVYVYADTADNSYTINITGGDSTFIKKITELGDYEWNNGNYKYVISSDDLNSVFDSVNDKNKVLITYDTGNLKSLEYKWNPYKTFSLQKNDEFIRLYRYEELRIDPIKIELAHSEEEEEEDEEEDEENASSPDETQKDNRLVKITVPDSLNIHKTAQIQIIYGETEIIKNLSELYNEYNYECLGVEYYLLLDNLNLKSLHNKDVVNISVTSSDEIIGSENFIMTYDNEEGWAVDYFSDSVELTFYYGEIGALEFGMGEAANKIVELTIPDCLNIT